MILNQALEQTLIERDAARTERDALRAELDLTRAQLAEAQERALRHADALGRLVLEMPSRAIKDAMSAPKHLKREASV